MPHIDATNRANNFQKQIGLIDALSQKSRRIKHPDCKKSRGMLGEIAPRSKQQSVGGSESSLHSMQAKWTENNGKHPHGMWDNKQKTWRSTAVNCLGRSDAPRCSFRSKCQVKALLHR